MSLFYRISLILVFFLLIIPSNAKTKKKVYKKLFIEPKILERNIFDYKYQTSIEEDEDLKDIDSLNLKYFNNNFIQPLKQEQPDNKPDISDNTKSYMINTGTAYDDLMVSIAGTETNFTVPGHESTTGKFSNRLKPIPGSVNGSFNPNLPQNLIKSSNYDQSVGVTASLSALGVDQPSFGIFQLTPLALSDIGMISIKDGNILRNQSLPLSMPGLVGQNITWNPELIADLGIGLNGNVITSISAGAAQTIVGSQAIQEKTWNPTNNILIGQPLNLFSEKIREMITLRKDDYNAMGADSLNSAYNATFEQNTIALNTQVNMMMDIFSNNWNRYIAYGPILNETQYQTLLNNVIGSQLTILNLGSTAYGANKGDPLTGPITLNGILSVMHIIGPSDGANLSKALADAYITNQEQTVKIQETDILVNFNQGSFQIDKSPTNYSDNYPTFAQYLMYHSVGRQITVQDMGTKWVSYDGKIMDGHNFTGEYAFKQIENTVTPNIINYNTSTNYVASANNSSSYQYFLPQNQSEINVNQGQSQNLTTLNTKINISSFNLSNNEQSGFVGHLVTRYYSAANEYLLTDNSVNLASSLNSNHSLIPSNQTYQLVYYRNLSEQDAWNAARYGSTAADFTITVTNPSGSADSLGAFGGSIGLEDFIFSDSYGSNLVDLSAVRNSTLWLDKNSSSIKMGYGNSLVYAAERSYKFYFNPNTATDSNITITGSSSNIGMLSYLIIPTNASNVKIENITSYYNSADLSPISSAYKPYSYNWNQSFSIGSNNYSTSFLTSGDFNYTTKQLNDIANLSLIQNEINAVANTPTLITQDRVLFTGTNQNDIVNIDSNANYVNIIGNGGDDTFRINIPIENTAIHIADFSQNDKIDISNFSNYGTNNLPTITEFTTPIDAHTNDYSITLLGQDNTTTTLYINSDHSLTAADLILKSN